MRFALQSRMYDDGCCSVSVSVPGGSINGNDNDNGNDIGNGIGIGNDIGNGNTHTTIDTSTSPKVEESIECVFGHQLEEGLEISVNDDDGDDDDDDYKDEKNECYAHPPPPPPPPLTSDSTIDEEYAHVAYQNKYYQNEDEYEYETMMVTPPSSVRNNDSVNASANASIIIPTKRYSSGKIVQVGSFSPCLQQQQEQSQQEQEQQSQQEQSQQQNPNREEEMNMNSKLSCINEIEGSCENSNNDGDAKNHEEGWSRSHDASRGGAESTSNSNGNVRSAASSSSSSSSANVNVNDNVNVNENENENVKESSHTNPNPHPFHCPICNKEDSEKIDPASKCKWPQYPLLLRPTPGSGTRIRGVRYADSVDYIMDSTCETHWWENRLKSTTSTNASTSTRVNRGNENEDGNGNGSTRKSPFCAECCPCPINNGNEEMNRTLVIDFESDIFEGTLQLRIRHSNGTNLKPHNDMDTKEGYFHGLNRHYQCLVQGRFKKEGIPMTTCVAGQTFSRPLHLPAPFIAKGALKVCRFLAPRMIAKIDCQKPYALSPLGSAPQVVCVDDYHDDGSGDGNFKADGTITGLLKEPVDKSKQLIKITNKASSHKSSASRAKARKKAFDKLCAEKDVSLTFRTDRVYTFEFLQHLMNFERFEVSIGPILGKCKVGPVLNGQPISLQALRQISYGKDPTFEVLWSFELWHKDIIVDQCKDK